MTEGPPNLRRSIEAAGWFNVGGSRRRTRHSQLLERCLLFLLFFPTPLVAQNSWEEIREIAGSQHEIVMLLIEEKEFDQVPTAARKIFEMQFPDNQHHLFVKEAEILTDALLQHNQTQIAHQLIEMARNAVKANKHKAALYREQAYVYKKEGNRDAAMECFQKSIELEQSGS